LPAGFPPTELAEAGALRDEFRELVRELEVP
jgi:hypothetical protein